MSIEEKQGLAGEAPKPAPAGKKKKDPLLRDVAQLLLKIGVLAACLIVLFGFVYGLARVPDVSMKPAVKDGDLALYYRLDKRFSVGDVAVVTYEGKTLLGRVAAMEGDTVDITADGLIVNGAIQVNPDIYFPTTQFADGVDFPLTVGAGQVFLLGDNRPAATDSRVYGCVDIGDVRGKVIAVIRTRGV